jgi:hypothetical protein
MQEKNAIGKDIESYCGRCKVSRDHTIMTMDGETIAKVRCKMCGSMHKFTSALEAQKVRKPRVKKTGDASTAETVWAAGLAQAKGKERDYSMTLKYRIGDIVNHDMFGKGVVLKLYANKCDMLFKDKERLMASTNQ